MASLVLVLLKVALLGTLAIVLLSPLVGILLMPVLRRLPPARRAIALQIACWLPLLGGAFVATVVAGPSLASLAGGYSGHCPPGAGGGHHHCVLHPGTALQLPWASFWLSLMGGGFAALMGRNALTLLREYRACRSLIRMADRGGRGEAGLVLATDRPFAGVLGLIRPRMVLSKGLVGLLNGQQRAVVEAHEQAHCARRDPLRLLLARFGALMHLPVVRRVLLREFLLATEQAADERAASEVGDRLTVAEAILAVARANPHRVGDLAFTGSMIDQRVDALINNSGSLQLRGMLFMTTLALFSVAVLASPMVHHSLESFLSAFLG